MKLHQLKFQPFQGFPPRTMKRKKVEKKELVEKYYHVVAIHKRQDLLDETIRLINSHWPKSRSERLSILGSSKDDLPMSLIVTFKRKQADATKETRIMNDIFFNQQSADAPTICSQTGRPINVLGHLRLVPVPADDKACFVESMVIHPQVRRPSEIVLEPLTPSANLPEYESPQESSFFCKPAADPPSWVNNLPTRHDAITMGLNLSEF